MKNDFWNTKKILESASIIFVTILICVACVPKNLTEAGDRTAITTLVTTLSPSIARNSTEESSENPTPIVICDVHPTTLVSFEQNSEVIRFHWSTDQHFLYFLQDNQWMKYILANKEILQTATPDFTKTDAPAFVYQLLSKQSWDERNLFVAPSNQQAIYIDFPLSFRQIEPKSESDYQFPADVFLLQDGASDLILIGTINYPINSVKWFADESKVLLQTAGVGEFVPDNLLYLFDISTHHIRPFLSITEAKTHKVRILDVSPDANWVLYQTTPGNHLTLKNTNDFHTITLSQLPTSVGIEARWLPNGDRIIVFTSSEPNYYDVYLYDTQSGNVTQITSNLRVNGTPFAEISISSEQTILTYADFVLSGPDALYLINLCLDVDK